jgi:type VI secretion system protein
VQACPSVGKRALHPLCVFLALFALLPFCAGCAPFTLKVKVTIESDANSNAPVMLSVLVVYKRDVLEKLQAISAKQWFQKREQFLRDHPKDIEEVVWEFVPGQLAPPFSRDVRWNAVQGVIFANYRAPGDHRYLFDPRGTTQITCGQKALTVVTTSVVGTLSNLGKKVPTEAPSVPALESPVDVGAFK